MKYVALGLTFGALLTPMTAFLVGLGLVGLLVLVFAGLHRRPGESEARVKSGHGHRDDRAA